MKISILTDNCPSGPEYLSEHGLSWHIDTGSSRILFDTGQSGIFAENASKMGVDLKLVDFLVLSHGHYDHTGGIQQFLMQNDHAQIVLKKEALIPKYHNNNSNIGINPELQLPEDRIIFVNDQQQLNPGVVAVGKIDIPFPDETHYKGFQIKKGGETLPDTFRDELYLAIIEGDKFSILTGCSHSGITNIIESARAQFSEELIAVYGGFHLASSSREDVLKTGRHLAKQSINKLVTCHCTGFENYKILKQETLPDLEYGFGGMILSQ